MSIGRLAAVVFAAALVAVFHSAAATSPEAAAHTVQPAEAAKLTRLYIGNATCGGAACHGSVNPAPKGDDRLDGVSNLFARHDELLQWKQRDRHEIATRVLTEPRGRRIAVLGDMLELGPKGRALHRGLAKPIIAHGIDLAFCCGPLMRNQWQALPATRRGGYADDSSALEAQVLPSIRAGDVVMVKGSLGSRMARIVKALQRNFPRHEAMEDALVVHTLASASAEG